jgi:GNAT superfamily N-acetyltransferase
LSRRLAEARIAVRARFEIMITFRPITETDHAFLRELYGSTRAQEMEAVPWPTEEKRAFLDMQFDAQHRFYAKQFPTASFELVLENGEAIGRLYVDRRRDEHRVIDIALLPEWRGRGVGGQLMRGLLEEAAGVGKMVRIHVERLNPAMRLYERLGFQKIEDQGVYDLMEWRPRAFAGAAQGGAG